MKKQHRARRAATLLLALAITWAMCTPAIAQEALTESQLQQIYNEAYDTEAAGLDAYIDDYVAHFDPAEYRQRQTHKMTEPIRDMASSSYQYVVDNYPEVAQYYANKVGSNFGGLSSLVSDATYDILTDQEASAVFGEIIGGALEFMDAFSYAMDQAEKNPNPERAMVVLQSSQYTVLRSSGMLSEVLGVKMDAANSIKIRIYGLQERKALLQESVNRYQQAYDALLSNGGAPDEDLQALSITIRSGQGMVDAVADRLVQEGQALEDELETWAGHFDGQPAGGETADDYAIYNIIDNRGNLTGAFCIIPKIDYYGLVSDGLSLRINRMGMISFQRESLDNSMIIIDKTGKILHRNSAGVYYSNITPGGNVLRVSEQSDFDNGDHYLIEVVRPDGSVAAEVGRARRDSLYINGETSVTTENDTLFNAIDDKLGTLMRLFPYKDSCYLRWQKVNGETVQGVLDLATGTFDASQPFTDEYAMSTGGFDVFNLNPASSSQNESAPASSVIRGNAGGGVVVAGYININSEYRLRQSDSVICDRMNRPKVDLSAGGGVRDICQDAEGLYWVVTNSGYYYIIDPNNNWHALFNPVQIGTGAATAFVNDRLAVQTDSGVDIYGKDGAMLFSCPGATLENGWANYLGSNKTGWYDMASGEVLNVAIPESGITFLHIDG